MGFATPSPLRRKTYQLVVQRHCISDCDSDMSSTDSDDAKKLDGFLSESLDAFDRNHWSTCPGIRTLPERHSGYFLTQKKNGVENIEGTNGSYPPKYSPITTRSPLLNLMSMTVGYLFTRSLLASVGT